MKKKIITTLWLLTHLIFTKTLAINELKHENQSSKVNNIFQAEEAKVEYPKYPGGFGSFKHKFMQDIKYPKKALKEKISGEVSINFTIDQIGRLSRPYFDKKTNSELDDEAMRCFLNIVEKVWTPAIQDGYGVPVTYNFPVKFNISGKVGTVVLSKEIFILSPTEMKITDIRLKSEYRKIENNANDSNGNLDSVKIVSEITACLRDEFNKPIPVAYLKIIESDEIIKTDVNGNFILYPETINSKIEISFLGKKTYRITTNDLISNGIENGKTSDTESLSNEDTNVYAIVEKLPEFQGGERGLSKFLSENIKYPAQAAKDNKQGKVLTSFIVEKDGSLSQIKIARSVHPHLDNEAIRIVKLMPKWIPGMQRGKPVRVSFILPINFVLN